MLHYSQLAFSLGRAFSGTRVTVLSVSRASGNLSPPNWFGTCSETTHCLIQAMSLQMLSTCRVIKTLRTHFFHAFMGLPKRCS